MVRAFSFVTLAGITLASSLAWAEGTFAEAEYEKCLRCISSGSKYQESDMCESRCMIADIGCFSDTSGCDAYKKELVDREACKAASSSSCSVCMSAADSCVWDAETMSCFEGSNMWAMSEHFITSSEKCNQVKVVGHCPAFVEDEQPLIPGGKTTSRRPDSDVKKIASDLAESIRSQVRALESQRQSLGENIVYDTSGDIEVCSYQSQVVAGTNYFILINFGSSMHFEVTVFKPLPYTDELPRVTALRAVSQSDLPTSSVVDESAQSEVDWCPDDVYESARPEQICMMMCPKPHCPEESKSENKMCAKKTDSCCGYECTEIKPPVKPCIMIDCAPGYDVMMTDERGCGGMCVAVCNRVKDMEECARMPECKVDKNAYEDPETFEVSDVCIESAGPVCCAAMTAGCLACSQGYKSAAAWCTDNPDKLNCADVKMPDTCKSCVASGLKWSAGSCFKECAMDVACSTTLKGCSTHDNTEGLAGGQATRVALIAGGSIGIMAFVALSTVYVRRKRALQERSRINSLSSLGEPIQFDGKKDAACASPEEEVVQGQPIVCTKSVVVV